jgi:hypothetical protein
LAAAQALAVRSLGVDGLFRWLNGRQAAPALDYGSLAGIAKVTRDQVATLRKYNKTLVAYEGVAAEQPAVRRFPE